jgi:restriction system protein
MGRRRDESLIEVLMHMPWWIGIAAGILGFIAVRWGAGWAFSASGGQLGRAVGAQLSGGVLTPLAWMVLVLCWIGALASVFRARSRAKLLDQQSSLDSLRSMSWQQFEQLVGEAYRRLGYRIEETGQGGADGGIDLLLRKDGATTLVQCKQWRAQKVGVAVVREMYGLMVHHNASAVKIVCTGVFSSECEAFARSKSLELVDGAALLRLVQELRSSPSPMARVPVVSRDDAMTRPQVPPTCPKCRSVMVERLNRGNGQRFWGCTRFPGCRGTIPI